MRRFAPWICAAVLGASIAAASPPSMEVAPTTLDLKPQEAGLFYVANRGSEPIVTQIEALDWSQTNGHETLTPSHTLFVSPPLATIAPGQRQTLRVLATETPGAAEIPHRLRISQLPGLDSANGVHLLLQFSVPVFVGSGQAAAPALTWRATQSGGGVVLSVRNDGTKSVKLEGLTLSGGDAPTTADSIVYVLPGGSRDILFKDRSNADRLHVAAQDSRSGTPVTADVVLHR